MNAGAEVVQRPSTSDCMGLARRRPDRPTDRALTVVPPVRPAACPALYIRRAGGPAGAVRPWPPGNSPAVGRSVGRPATHTLDLVVVVVAASSPFNRGVSAALFAAHRLISSAAGHKSQINRNYGTCSADGRTAKTLRGRPWLRRRPSATTDRVVHVDGIFLTFFLQLSVCARVHV